ncbi:hypothetical protein H7I76_09875 [Mycolicibacterium vaccae]|nr:hypothetical protein [Mycolicibacterium vaccae]
MRQFDVRLDGVDIVSVGFRRGPKASRGVESAVQDDFGAAGEQRPLDERRTWLVVRMDPQNNVAAVAARDSVAATLAAATERIAHDLDGRQCMARPLRAAEIEDVDDAVLAGLESQPDPAVLAISQASRRIRDELWSHLRTSPPKPWRNCGSRTPM